MIEEGRSKRGAGGNVRRRRPRGFNSRRDFLVLACAGLACGLLSGLFGIGGGTIIVPALVWLGLSQRHAAATSLAAIVPTSVSGVVSYATEGNVNWIAAILLVIGVIAGSQIGSLLLNRLPEVALRWIWVVFLIFVIIQQLVFIPQREGHLVLHFWSGVFLMLLGVVVGSIAGILGIGGGAIMMPAVVPVRRERPDGPRHVTAGDVPRRDFRFDCQLEAWHRASEERGDHRRVRDGDGAVGHVDRRADFAACRFAAVRRMACIAGRTRRMDRHQGDECRASFLSGAQPGV